jgi:hypothetical protein|tara:strand:+ start:722 stop:976 length:255 start_codon:yes stop_codon:yes gene_type:complete
MERPIPEFRHRDKVRISTEYSGPQAGKTGVIFGSANVVPMTSFEPVADGQDITGEQVTYMYQVDLDDSDTETVSMWESELTLVE